jgi:hypothetical protein
MDRMLGTRKQITLVDGTAVSVEMRNSPLPSTVWVKPVAGDTVAVKYSVDGGVTYSAWPPGAVTVATDYALYSSVTHLQFQRTVGTGITSVCGIL